MPVFRNYSQANRTTENALLGHRCGAVLAFSRGYMRSPVSIRALGECNAITSRGFSHSELTFVNLFGNRVRRFLECALAAFYALFAYNDISAIGSIHAFLEADLRVPNDLSVVGFDDIQKSAYISPPLTTVRQLMKKMGEIAARTLLDRIEGTRSTLRKLRSNPSRSTARPHGHK